MSALAAAASRWLTAVRSAVFLTLLFASIAVFGLCMFLTLPLDVRWRIAYVKGWVRLAEALLGVCCGLGYRIEGLENLPSRPAIIFARHSSAWETLLLQRHFPPFVWIIKRELLWVPFFGWGLAMLHAIGIDRKRGRSAVEQIVSQGIQRLRDGYWVMIFPETTRMAPGRFRRYGMGGAVLASRSGAPVVPVAHNAGCYWRRRGFLKYPGTIRVVVGEPIETAGLAPEQINARAKAWIDATTQRLEEEAPAR